MSGSEVIGIQKVQPQEVSDAFVALPQFDVTFRTYVQRDWCVLEFPACKAAASLFCPFRASVPCCTIPRAALHALPWAGL